MISDTVLIYAVTNSYKNIVEMLLKRGADVNLSNTDNETAFIKAVGLYKLDIVKLLLNIDGLPK